MRQASIGAGLVRKQVVTLFGLMILKVSDVEPFNGIEAAPNAFVIVGGARLSDSQWRCYLGQDHSLTSHGSSG